ncbi:hypothetical protein SUGI_0737100 [Cryptomeria japonica]|nr:hypothetical protein SUGI_0737100 [Cryptomeria japonica]
MTETETNIAQSGRAAIGRLCLVSWNQGALPVRPMWLPLNGKFGRRYPRVMTTAFPVKKLTTKAEAERQMQRQTIVVLRHLEASLLLTCCQVVDRSALEMLWKLQMLPWNVLIPHV